MRLFDIEEFDIHELALSAVEGGFWFRVLSF